MPPRKKTEKNIGIRKLIGKRVDLLDTSGDSVDGVFNLLDVDLGWIAIECNGREVFLNKPDRSHHRTSGEGSMSSAVLENELALISNRKIKAFTGLVLELAPEYFWTASSSSTAKHHLPQSNVSGGLVNHVKGVVVIANKICDLFKIVEDQRDAVLSACILHDVTKYSDYKRGILHKQKYTTKTHDYDGAKFVHSIGKKIESESGEEIPLPPTVTGCIAWHMGRWTVRNNGHAVKTFPDEYSIPEMIVHVSDCIAAIKDIHWLSLEQSLKA